MFAVDTIANRCPDCEQYTVEVTVTTKENYQLVLKSKSYYNEATHTQFNPALYELYNGDKLL